MAKVGVPGHDPVPIGEVSAPPFARAPEPARLFADRAARLTRLADGHALGPYLLFIAGIAEVQHSIQDGLPAPAPVAPDELDRRRRHGMPALDRSRFPEQELARDTLRRFLAGAAGIEMPAAARAALDAVAGADAEALALGMGAVLDDAVPFDAVAEHAFVAAGLEVHAARTAAGLDARALVAVGVGACPACGSPPVSSLVVGWRGAHGARFCVCALCCTLWNHVRIRCTACGSTKGIGYREVEGAGGAIKAETCAECRTYLKILYQVKDAALDPVADDLASTALDLLVAESGLRRSGRNPFLFGY